MTPKNTSPLTRRQFLQNSTAAVAAVGLSSFAQSSFAQETERKIGYALVGLGSLTQNQLMPAFAECKHSKIVALVSGSPDKAKNLATRYNVPEKNIYNYENYDSIKDNPEVDVIYNVLPNGMHADFTIRGFKAGKHVLCEKPMANTAKECEDMIAAGKAAGKKLMVAYRCQYEPHYLETQRILRAGEIGRPLVFKGDAGFRINDPTVWRLNAKLAGGGSLMDIGIYAINAVRFFTGEEPSEVSASTFQPTDDPRFKEVEESCVWHMKFPSGLLASCSTSYNYVIPIRFHMFGTKANLDLDPAMPYRGVRAYKSIRGPQGQTEIVAPEINHFTAEMDHFSESILNNTEPKTPGEEGLRDVKIMMAIYEAAKSGKSVKV